MTTEEQAAQEAAAAQEASSTEPAPVVEEPAATAAESAPASPYEGLPEDFKWMVKELESTRREAAAARVSARETAEKFKDAKTPEEVEALKAELVQQTAAAERRVNLMEAVHKHAVPEELVEFITGETPDEIEAQAAKLASVKATAPVITKLPPAGGSKPVEDPAEIDGRAEYRKYKARK